MITRDQAERIVAEMTGAPAGQPGGGWELQEFSAGWLLVDHGGQGRRAAPEQGTVCPDVAAAVVLQSDADVAAGWQVGVHAGQ
jgi:hypothetical protein